MNEGDILNIKSSDFLIISSKELFDVERSLNSLKMSFVSLEVIFSFFQIPVLLSKEQLLKIVKIANA